MSPPATAQTAAADTAQAHTAWTTLFGELAPQRGGATPRPDAAADELVVDASPAAAMRAHFAATRSDLSQASPMIALIDPTGQWAPNVIRALSDAASMPVRQLVVRERSTLRALATLSRTSVPRHGVAPLKVYHAEIRTQGLEAEEIAGALAESSQLTAVIAGALPPEEFNALLASLLNASHGRSWRCEWLVFILPTGAPALRHRVLDQPWPAGLRVAAMAESLASPAGVWNAVLTAWEASRLEAAPVLEAPPQPSYATAAAQALRPVAGSEGLLACGIVDLDQGELLAAETRGESVGALGPLAAALCAARQAQIDAGPGGAAPEEILITIGTRQTMLRTLPRHKRLAFVAHIDRAHANLALLRFRMLEAERHFD